MSIIEELNGFGSKTLFKDTKCLFLDTSEVRLKHQIMSGPLNYYFIYIKKDSATDIRTRSQTALEITKL